MTKTIENDQRGRGSPVAHRPRRLRPSAPPLGVEWLSAPAWECQGERLDIFADREFGGASVSVIERSPQDGSADLSGGVACTAVLCISLPTLPDEAFDGDFDAAEAYAQWR